jgi:hypothetical protein
MRRRLGQVDLETGEILKGVAVWVGVKSSPFGKRKNETVAQKPGFYSRVI